QRDHKHRATLESIVASDPALMVLNDAVGGAQSEPGAFAYGFRGVKRVEDSRRILQALSAVCDLYHYVIFVAIGAHRHLTAADLRQCIDCVVHEVKEHLQ